MGVSKDVKFQLITFPTHLYLLNKHIINQLILKIPY
jgi:hypothetical protein